jgi:hypothetical protein
MEKINTLKCLTIAFMICFSHFCTVTSEKIEQKMIIDAINYCDTLTVLHESSYMTRCSEIPLPTTFIKNDIDLALCMMVLDTMDKICQNVVNKEYEIKIPESVKQLDDSIRKFEPKPSNYDAFIANLCKTMVSVFNNWSDLGIQNSLSVDLYSKYVSGILFEQHECGYTCHKPNNTVNPLCMIFLWFNELLGNLKRLKNLSSMHKNIRPANSAIGADKFIVQNESSTLENTKNSHINIIEHKTEKFEDHTSPINKIFTKQPENRLLSNGSNKSDDSNAFSIHNEYALKKYVYY